jgi:hypothetical protein
MPKSKKTQATPAADLLVMFERGESDDAEARIRTLSQRDFIQIMRAIQELDGALCAYAEGWKGAEYWGRGTPYPDES